MRKIITLTLLLISISIFAKNHIAQYSYDLTRIERLDNDSIKYDETNLTVLDAGENKKSRFEDENLQISWRIDGKRFWFTLLNKTKYPIELDWDKISYIDTERNAGNVIHNGINYMRRNNGQPSTLIPQGSQISDFLVPSNNCQLIQGGMFSVGGWVENYLFPCVYKKKKLMFENAPNFIGNTLRIILPIKIKDAEYIYDFEFTITDFISEQ